jgi:hypothetical protein
MVVHQDAGIAVTKYMTQNPLEKIVGKTGPSKNQKQHAVGCEYIHIKANGGQLTV